MGTVNPPGQPSDYPRRSFVDDLLGPRKEGAESLAGGVAQVFPPANPGRLSKVLEMIREKSELPREQILFLALICGVRFSVQRPDVSPVLGKLWSWLTGNPRLMPGELADLLVEALSPGLERALLRRGGTRLGPRGHFEKVVGRPLEARGAWTVAVLLDHGLRCLGSNATLAVELSVRFAEVLLGRDGIEAAEFYAIRDAMGKPDPSTLFGELDAQYRYWVVHDWIRSKDPRPLSDGRESDIKSEAPHQELPKLLDMWGSYGLALKVLERIPPELWAPFLKRSGAEPEVTERSE